MPVMAFHCFILVGWHIIFFLNFCSFFTKRAQPLTYFWSQNASWLIVVLGGKTLLKSSLMFFFNLHAAVKYLLVLISTFPHVLSIQIHAHTRSAWPGWMSCWGEPLKHFWLRGLWLQIYRPDDFLKLGNSYVAGYVFIRKQ